MKKNDKPSEDPVRSYRSHRRFVRIGQVLMAVLVAISHWIAHRTLQAGAHHYRRHFIGYPTGALLIMIGAILTSLFAYGSGSRRRHKTERKHITDTWHQRESEPSRP